MNLKKKAAENTQVSVQDTTIKEVTEIKKGSYPDTSDKTSTAKRNKIVGMSAGVTLSMGNFQSLRADVWLSDEVGENETIPEAYTRIEKIIEEQLRISVESLKETL